MPSVKKNTRQTGCLPNVFFFAIGKEIKKILKKNEKKKMKKKLCRVPRSRTLGKEIKSFFPEKEGEIKNKKNFAECPDLGHSAKK